MTLHLQPVSLEPSRSPCKRMRQRKRSNRPMPWSSKAQWYPWWQDLRFFGITKVTKDLTNNLNLEDERDQPHLTRLYKIYAFEIPFQIPSHAVKTLPCCQKSCRLPPLASWTLPQVFQFGTGKLNSGIQSLHNSCNRFYSCFNILFGLLPWVSDLRPFNANQCLGAVRPVDHRSTWEGTHRSSEPPQQHQVTPRASKYIYIWYIYIYIMYL